MSRRVFRITELEVSDIDAEVFEWTEENHAAPEDGWQAPIRQHTVRRVLPGGRVIVQKLGARWPEQTLKGQFLDRYMGAGRAREEVERLYQLVASGRPVKIEHEDLGFIADIDEFSPTKLRQEHWLYEIKIAPRRRRPGDAQSPQRIAKIPSPEALRSPESFAEEFRQHAAKLQDAHGLAPRLALTGTVFASINSKVLDVTLAVTTASEIVRQQTQAVLAPIETAKQAAGAFVAVRSFAVSLVAELEKLTRQASLAYETGATYLAYEAWVRLLAGQARALITFAWRAEKEMRRRSRPKATRYHRPYAGEHLQAIAARFYRDPRQWQRLLVHNRLPSPVLTGEEILEIPEAVG